MKQKISKAIFAVLLAAAVFVLALVQPFYSLDHVLTDVLYSRLRGTDASIVLICIDEPTLAAYGSFASWSRSRTAELVNLLYSEPENAPAVVGLDITFQGESGTDADALLAASCEGRNVVVSAPLVFRGGITEDREYDARPVSVEYPYPALDAQTKPGFTNAVLGRDGINRYYRLKAQLQGQILESFAWRVAEEYCRASGRTLEAPRVDAAGIFRFFYAGCSGEFTHISMKRVLDGKIPLSEFRGKMVLVGAYASGMQDSYFATADAGGSIFGMEVQANVIQALLEGVTAVPVPAVPYSAVLAAAVLVLYILSNRRSLLLSMLIPGAGLLAHMLAGFLLARWGLLIPQLYAVIFLAGLLAWNLIRKYIQESRRKRQIVKTFSKYMEPKLVEQLSRGNDASFTLGGQRREVAVLFVDIRGFTSMSESLQPEEVVGILNSYLGLVTECVFRHHGMLDKFIGDAAMAVFNAPVNQADYLYEAVAAAWDIAEGSRRLESELMQRFGRSVSYGIGVNCGPAVIGNIGCEFRMDYTAIGDTVNTAARLESNAGRGETLISDAVYQQLKDRILTENAGAMTFKGKSKPMDVYRVVGLRNKGEMV